MINVTFIRKDDVICGFISEGHAGYAEEGEDIVCSAVSVLTLNTCNALETLTEDSYTLDMSPDGGYLKLVMDGEFSHDSELLLASLHLGIRSVCDAYGDFLQVNYQDL